MYDNCILIGLAKFTSAMRLKWMHFRSFTSVNVDMGWKFLATLLTMCDVTLIATPTSRLFKTKRRLSFKEVILYFSTLRNRYISSSQKTRIGHDVQTSTLKLGFCEIDHEYGTHPRRGFEGVVEQLEPQGNEESNFSVKQNSNVLCQGTNMRYYREQLSCRSMRRNPKVAWRPKFEKRRLRVYHGSPTFGHARRCCCHLL